MQLLLEPCRRGGRCVARLVRDSCLPRERGVGGGARFGRLAARAVALGRQRGQRGLSGLGLLGARNCENARVLLTRSFGGLGTRGRLTRFGAQRGERGGVRV